jgi:hypothetical protein
VLVNVVLLPLRRLGFHEFGRAWVSDGWGFTVLEDEFLLNGLYFNSILLVSIGKTKFNKTHLLSILKPVRLHFLVHVGW